MRLDETRLAFLEFAVRFVEQAFARPVNSLVIMRERVARMSHDLERRKLHLFLVHIRKHLLAG